MVTISDYNKLVENIDNINYVNDLCRLIKISKNEAYYIILSDPLLNKLKWELPPTLIDFKTKITDIKNVEIVDEVVEGDSFCITIIFIDQDNNVRLAEIMNDNKIYGRLYYLEYCEKAKQDTINIINTEFYDSIKKFL